MVRGAGDDGGVGGGVRGHPLDPGPPLTSLAGGSCGYTAGRRIQGDRLDKVGLAPCPCAPIEPHENTVDGGGEVYHCISLSRFPLDPFFIRIRIRLCFFPPFERFLLLVVFAVLPSSSE